MIIQLTGNVNFKITLDPTVWIFDDRKIILEDLYTEKVHKVDEETDAEKHERRLGQEAYQQRVKPPINKSINRFEREKILENSYVMPIEDFVNHAEVRDNANDVLLETTSGEVIISLTELENSYLLFAIKGKPVKEDGPVHLYFKDPSKQDTPIKGVKKITIQ